jgi:hypothetical protein
VWGVLPQNALVEWIDFPHPPCSCEHHSRSSASAFYFRTAADGGQCSPASGRGKTNGTIQPKLITL